MKWNLAWTHHVQVGNNNGVQKLLRREIINTPRELSTVNFSHPHPEHDKGCCRPVRIQYEPRSLGDRNATFTKDDWEAVAEATDGTARVCCSFDKQKFQTIAKQIHQSKSRSIPDIAATSNIYEFYVDLKQEAEPASKLTTIKKNLTCESNFWIDFS